MPDIPEKSNGATPVRYRRVPGLRFHGAFSRSILRQADDHILVCDFRTSFIERYKRFYFRDIEAFIIQRTSNWLFGVGIWGSIAFLLGMIAYGFGWNRYVTLGLEGFCVLFIVRHLAAGPSCRTRVQTAVQTDRLPMLKRLRRTNRVLTELIPLIEAAQGGRFNPAALQPNELSRSLPSGALASPSGPAGVSSSAAVPVLPIPGAVTSFRLSIIHLVAFFLALATGGISLWDLSSSSTFSVTAMVALYCLCGIFALAALIRQARRRVHRGAAIMTWVLGVVLFFGGSGVEYGYTMFDYILRLRIQAATHKPVVMTAVTPMRMRHMAGFETVLLIFGMVLIVLGAVGLIFVFLRPVPRPQPPPIPAS